MDRALQINIESDPLLRTAAEWFVELRQSNVTAERVAAWQSWLAAAETHREAFAHIERLWVLPRQLSVIPWPTDTEVAEDTYDGTVDISSWCARSLQREAPPPAAHRSARARWMLPRTLAASLAVVLVAALVWSASATWPQWNARLRGGDLLTVETAAGVRQTITLSDGSVVNAGALTRLNVALSNEKRSIVLERGEAFFEVAKDASRPFIVKAGDTAVTAVGTAFNVRRARERVVVAVAEGRVRIETTEPQSSADAGPTAVSHRRTGRLEAQLRAGQQLALGPEEIEPRIAAIDAGAVGGWREGRLQYLNEPLENVIADLARYSAREIHIADAHVGALRVTATVFETNVDDWLESLETSFPLQITQRSDGVIELQAR